MAQAILDRLSTASTPTAEKSPEAIAHDKRMKELYKRFFSAEASDEAVAEDYAATFAARSAAPAEPAVQAISAPVQERTEPVRTEPLTDYKDHRIGKPEAVSVAPAAESEADDGANDEDLIPTRRTMQTLQRATRTEDAPAALHSEEQHVGFFASLSARTKTVLYIVAAAIVVAIALVCINTGILNSMDARIAARNSELTDLSQRYAEIREELDVFHDPDYTDDYAQSVEDMIRGEAQP